MASLAKFHYDHVYFTPLNCGRFYLHQVGDLCCNSSYEVPEHLHNCYEVSFIESGKALFIINGEEFHVKKSDLILTRIGDSHYIRSSADDPVRYFYFALNFNEESPDYPKFAEIRQYFDTTENRVTTDTLDIYSVFYKIFSEMKISDAFFLEMIEANLTQLLVMSYRNLLKTNTSRYCPQVNVRVEDSLVYDVINLIDSGSYNIKNLGNIGKEVGYSYPYLSQIFSKKVGKSIMEYCQQRLFEKAVMMLEDNVSITNIAEKLGYKSIHSFSRAFSNYYGVSPSKYKVAMTGRHAAPSAPIQEEEQIS